MLLFSIFRELFEESLNRLRKISRARFTERVIGSLISSDMRFLIDYVLAILVLYELSDSMPLAAKCFFKHS